ncbi:hypothetical protein A2188_03385 [Candidatus Woesebacteria bacterium RIFOXYA1_FULL_43_9]|uniref:Uncharacterized protein n=1 Tax=Candidatus Woesebacteria bacterium RIFOXYA1_FULL_43_9 TaxID=1802534 RepID=A0A1F8CPS8_9BACT|nr:MAG: hypothetical protein A2188_03385 [Candidatus Woesebacteria bacterium RIFOXYA1_FULL_43_9]
MSTFPHTEPEFSQWLVSEYFKHGTVEEVLRVNRYSLPISTATYHRILNQFGVVKTAGPNNLLNEAVDFLSHMLHDTSSIEEVYKKLPLKFQTSLSTIYRIAEYAKEGLTRRVGVGLVITPFDNNRQILLAEDVSTPRIELGKPYDSISLPMGYAKKRESRRINVLRILQQEVFTDLVIKQSFPKELVTERLEPFMYLDIADVRVAIFHLQLPKDLSAINNFSSYKLKNHRFIDIDEVNSLKNVRVGVKEVAIGYQKYLDLLSRNLVVNPMQAQSFLNQELATVSVEVGA